MKATSCILKSKPKYPLAITIPSEASNRSSKFSTAFLFMILVRIFMYLPLTLSNSLSSLISSLVSTLEIEMKSTPSLIASQIKLFAIVKFRNVTRFVWEKFAVKFNSADNNFLFLLERSPFPSSKIRRVRARGWLQMTRFLLCLSLVKWKQIVMGNGSNGNICHHRLLW